MSESLRVPVFCPICEEVMKGSRSVRTYYDWGCCMHCHVEFVEDREERWRDGWRPGREEIIQKRGGNIWETKDLEIARAPTTLLCSKCQMTIDKCNC